MVMENPEVTANPVESTSKEKICKNKNLSTLKSNHSIPVTSGFDIPLINAIQQNFSASSLFANFYVAPPPATTSSPTCSNKTNDTATTEDSTAESPSYESFDKEKKSEFACWLASQEFDASAIITSDEDGGDCKVVQDVNISGISDDFPVDGPVDNLSGSSPEVVNNTAPRSSKAASMTGTRKEKAEAAQQSWWFNPSLEALWEQILSSRHCNCLVGTTWHAEEAGATDADRINSGKAADDLSNNDIDPSSNMNQSASFVIPSEDTQPATARSPFQRKVASTPVETCHMSIIPKAHEEKHNSPLRANQVGASALVSNMFSDNIISPSLTQNPSEVSCRSAATPLIGEYLVSTPLAGEHYMSHENSIMSKASSQLLGEDIIDFNQVDYYPPPPHLLRAIMPQKELLFTCNKQDFKLSNTDDMVFELSISKSQEGRALGLGRSDKLMKRVKEKRRQRRNDQV
ncbi:hypothetical protein HJC23_012669 [Cyclotella cryptica]|uniref:Uncharacterized protein n=1 Tax=Cyclotella cryptica TaxID=29204 RepID=A0ABD3QMP4_9STRA